MKTEFIIDLPHDWQPAAKVFAALGDDMRQKILLLFEPGEELSIKNIADIFPLSRTSIVHHLLVLERAGILESRRQGKAALYRLRVERVLEALDRLRDYIHDTFPPALLQSSHTEERAAHAHGAAARQA